MNIRAAMRHFVEARMLVVYIFMRVVFAVEPMHQACSKYDYEAKLLERVIQNEMALKDTFHKITETNAKIEDTLKTVQEDNLKLKDAISALEAKKIEIDEKVGAVIDSVLTNVTYLMGDLKSTQQKELATIKETSVVRTILFHARSPSSTYYSTDQDFVFKTILVNEGGGYDPNTGRFTATIAGVYVFSAQVCTSGGHNAQFAIILDNKALQMSVHMDETYHSCTTLQAFARVTVNAKAWIRSTTPSNIIDTSSYWTSFSGLLVHL